MYIDLHESTVYPCQILIKLEFSRQIFEKKKTQISNFMKIRRVGADLFHADGRTDIHNEAIVGARLTRRMHEYHHIQVTSSVKNVF
jgi:hypothetical protein